MNPAAVRLAILAMGAVGNSATARAQIEIVDPKMQMMAAQQINDYGLNCPKFHQAWVMGHDEFGILIRVACSGPGTAPGGLRYRVSIHPKSDRVMVRIGW